MYSRSREEYAQNLRIVLQTLRYHVLFAKFSECEFWLELVTFFRHVVSKAWIMSNRGKIEAIHDWSRPTDPLEVYRFIGLASYYR